MTTADESPCDPLAAGEDDDPARWTMETDDAAGADAELLSVLGRA